MMDRVKRCALVLGSALLVLAACGGANRHHVVRTVYVKDCQQEVAADLHSNGSVYLKGTDIPFHYGENCN
jgi:hypothetical protein